MQSGDSISHSSKNRPLQKAQPTHKKFCCSKNHIKPANTPTQKAKLLCHYPHPTRKKTLTEVTTFLFFVVTLKVWKGVDDAFELLHLSTTDVAGFFLQDLQLFVVTCEHNLNICSHPILFVHLETREKSGSKKYYLAHSYRAGDAVKKISVYLGSNLTPQELESKRNKAETKLRDKIKAAQAINDPYFTALSSFECKELKTVEARGELHVLHLSDLDWDKFKEAFTYNTNAIEGSYIESGEVKDILREDKWPEGKNKEDIAETYGVAQAIDYIRSTEEQISLDLIKEIHRIVFKNSMPFAGKFREKGVEVLVADANGNVIHRGAPSEKVSKLLKDLIVWYHDNKTEYPPLVLAAVVHNQFEMVHPFQDGNGRVGRILLNNILLKNNLPPLNIELKNRKEYYAALQAYEGAHNLRPTLDLMLKEYRTLKKMIS
jgi:Fic family protein